MKKKKKKGRMVNVSPLSTYRVMCLMEKTEIEIQHNKGRRMGKMGFILTWTISYDLRV